MQEPLKVLMMGGRRCGKTSALASLFNEMKSGPVQNYFTVSDRTVLETKGFETQDSLSNKTLELQNMLFENRHNSNIFLVDQHPTENFWLYKLHIQIPGTKREMDIEFRDSAGEFFEASGVHAEETRNYISDCDVFVIVVDTPYLMGSVGDETKVLCNEAINNGTNRVNDIQDFLTHIDDNDGQDAKMVVFVPLKCEKWMKENRIGEVVERIKEVYATTIKNLKAYSKMHISIIPMLTSGNILFSEFRKAMVYNDVDGTKRCCRISDDIIRLENGDNEMVEDKSKVKDDPNAIIAGTTLMRPYAWYHVNPEDGSYAPMNCDQLPLHILRFMLAKLFDAETRTHSGFGGFFLNLINRLKRLFGSIDPKELQQKIFKMQQDGIIKDNVDGIEVIKRF